MLWDARDGILSTEDAPAQLASLTRGAPDGGGDAGSKDSHGFDIFEWASTSLRIAARRAGAETASAALALLHATNGLTGFADEKDAADAKAREAKEARRDADKSTRSTRASEAETKSRDVRLKRALEEVERYKNLLAEAKDERKGGG